MAAFFNHVKAASCIVSCLSLLSHSPSHASAQGVQTQQALPFCLDLGLDFTPPEPKEWTFWRGNQQTSEMRLNDAAIARITINYNDSDPPVSWRLVKPEHTQVGDMTFEYEVREQSVRWFNSFPSAGFIVERKYQFIFDRIPTIDNAVQLYVKSRTHPRAEIFIEYEGTRPMDAIFNDIYCLLTTPKFMENLR